MSNIPLKTTSSKHILNLEKLVSRLSLNEKRAQTLISAKQSKQCVSKHCQVRNVVERQKLEVEAVISSVFRSIIFIPSKIGFTL